MTRARIYQPSPPATQSGGARHARWILEYEPAQPRFSDGLTGWTGSGDMRSQIRLRFKTRAQAEAYAKRQGIAYHVARSRAAPRRPKSYAENFSPQRRQAWTH